MDKVEMKNLFLDTYNCYFVFMCFREGPSQVQDKLFPLCMQDNTYVTLCS